jgi:tripartite-type tricarboxylate transporter receptor subunit TctC
MTLTKFKRSTVAARIAPLACVVATFVAMSDNTARGETYPSRPITMVVPFGAGGPTDTIARILADRMGAWLHGSVIVEDIGGAAGSIGAGKVAQARPDGYTISIGHWGTHAVNSLIYPLKYDVLNDLAPIALVASNPYLILSKKSVPASNLKGLIGWLKANPHNATVATNGIGSAGFLIGTQFGNLAGVHFQFVPYKGGVGASMKDLIAGQIDMMFDQVATSLPQVRAQRIKAYAVTANKRLKIASGIPTVDEAGLPGFHLAAWHGLWAPKNTPRGILAKLNAAAVATLADASVRARLLQLGQDVPTRGQQTPAALAAQQRAEIERWRPIIKATNITAR